MAGGIVITGLYESCHARVATRSEASRSSGRLKS